MSGSEEAAKICSWTSCDPSVCSVEALLSLDVEFMSAADCLSGVVAKQRDELTASAKHLAAVYNIFFTRRA